MWVEDRNIKMMINWILHAVIVSLIPLFLSSIARYIPELSNYHYGQALNEWMLKSESFKPKPHIGLDQYTDHVAKPRIITKTEIKHYEKEACYRQY